MFLGIDLAAIPALLARLRGWTPPAEAAIGLVAIAESLSEITTGAQARLEDIASTGRLMAARIEQARAALLGHVIEVPVTTAHVSGAAGLVAAIRADTAAGRNPAERFDELYDLVTQVTAGDRELARVAVSMILDGADVDDVLTQVSGGANRLYGRIAMAMEHGQAPSEVGIADELFPDGYGEWHRLDAEIADLQARQDRIPKGTDLSDPRYIAHLSEHLATQADLAESQPVIAALARIKAGTPFRELPDDERAALRGFEKVVAARDIATGEHIDALRVERQDLALPYLGGGEAAVGIDDDGRVGRFEAIGAIMESTQVDTSSFAGRQYALMAPTLGRDQMGLAAAIVAGEPGAAMAFFHTIDPRDAGVLLENLGYDSGEVSDPASLRNLIAHDLGEALALASPTLAPGWASAMIGAGGPRRGPRQQAPAEWLLVNADFDPEFLLEATEASLISYGDPLGPPPSADRIDPRSIVLGRVAEHDLGVELVVRLDANATIDSLIWAGHEIVAPTTHPGLDIPLDDIDEVLPLWWKVPPVSQVLVQAAADDRAANAVIESAVSRVEDYEFGVSASVDGRLAIDVANGVSYILSTRVDPPHEHVASLDSPLLQAAFAVYDAGAGIDIDAAVRSAHLDALISEMGRSESDWDTESLADYGTLAGALEVLRFEIAYESAADYDESVHNANSWISNLSALGGLTLGMVLPALSVALTVAGWGAPKLIPAGESVEGLFGSEWLKAIDLGRGAEALVLTALLKAGAIDAGSGSIALRPGGGGRQVVVFDDGTGAAPLVEIDPSDSAWVEAFDSIDQELAVAGSELDEIVDHLSNATLAEPVEELMREPAQAAVAAESD